MKLTECDAYIHTYKCPEKDCTGCEYSLDEEREMTKNKKRIAVIKSMRYDVLYNFLEVVLYGYPYVYFINIKEIHYCNSEVVSVGAESKIMFDPDYSLSARVLHNVIVLSDGIREVDENGNLIKW